MRRHSVTPRSAFLLAALCATPLAASTPLAAQTRMLRSPTVSEKHIAFAYANNIWIVDRAGAAASGSSEPAESCDRSGGMALLFAGVIGIQRSQGLATPESST